jgi:protein SCO1/2
MGGVRFWPAVVLLALVSACGSDEPALPGTVLTPRPAPDFRLADQTGRQVSLADFRGKAVVLTFMYTSCPDFCPATAAKLRQTAEHLGRDAEQVALLAVSVDPEHDTQEAAREFSARHRMPAAIWHYLIGSAEELAPVWQAYYIGTTPPVAGVQALGHTEALFVIDAKGEQRTLIRGDFDPAELAQALRALVR